MDYLGHGVLPGKLKVATDTAAALKEFVFPQTLTQLRFFLGDCNVYRRFVKDFSKISRPLTGMLKKEASRSFENPTEEQLTAFETLKDRLTSPPVLALPKAGRNYRLDTDASDYQLGCTIRPKEYRCKPEHLEFRLRSASEKLKALPLNLTILVAITTVSGFSVFSAFGVST